MRAFVKVAIFLLVLAVCLLAGTWLGSLIKNDPGYVLLSYDTLTVETSLWFGAAVLLLAFIAAYLSLRLIGKLWDSTIGVSRVWANIRGRSARGETQKGFMELRMGRYEAALKHLTHGAPRSDTAFINYLSAAEAANALGRSDQRDELLVKALEVAPKAELAVGLAEARMQHAAGQFAECQTTLDALRSRKPKDKELITLSCQIARELGDTDRLVSLLPVARKLKVLDEATLHELEVAAHRMSLEQAADDADGAKNTHDIPLSLANTWDAVPKRIQSEPDVVEAYTRGLVASGATDAALAQLETLLKRNPDSALFSLYSQLSGADIDRRLTFINKKLKNTPNMAAAQLARGRLALAQGDLPQAEEALTASVEAEPGAEVYDNLAQLYKAQERPDMERDALRAMADFARSWPGVGQLPVPVESEPASRPEDWNEAEAPKATTA